MSQTDRHRWTDTDRHRRTDTVRHRRTDTDRDRRTDTVKLKRKSKAKTGKRSYPIKQTDEQTERGRERQTGKRNYAIRQTQSKKAGSDRDGDRDEERSSSSRCAGYQIRIGRWMKLGRESITGGKKDFNRNHFLPSLSIPSFQPRELLGRRRRRR